MRVVLNVVVVVVIVVVVVVVVVRTLPSQSPHNSATLLRKPVVCACRLDDRQILYMLETNILFYFPLI